jgi:hypothetical protein
MNAALLGNWVGLALWCVSLSIVFHSALRRAGEPRARRLAVLLWATLVPLAFLARGLFGELSLAAPVLVFWLVRRPPLMLGGRVLVAAVALSGFVLTASGLGWIESDLYSWGYALGADSPVLPYALGVLLLVGWRFARPLAWAWLLGIGLFALRLLPSPNVWDVLIDFPSTLIAATLTVLAARQSVLARRRIAGF